MVSEHKLFIHFGTLREAFVLLHLLESAFLHAVELEVPDPTDADLVVFFGEGDLGDFTLVEVETGNHSVFLEPLVDQHLAVWNVQNASNVFRVV